MKEDEKDISDYTADIHCGSSINKESIIGKTKLMKNGLLATCVAYRSAVDIDIKFEDGTIVRHKAKSAFKRGEIAHPSINAKVAKSSCLGEIRKMKNGQSAICIDYKNSKQVTVRFEDGTIVPNKSKEEFYRGTIGNPSIGTRATSLKPITGEKKIMHCGLEAVVIADRNSQDIDVEFEDGFVVRHRGRADFRRAEISHPLYPLTSFPQQLIAHCVNKYFPDIVSNYRAPFLKNGKSGHRLEIDVWIPSLKVGIEYDGYPWHKHETQQSKAKYDAIKKSDKIEKIFTLIENGCIEHVSPKHHNFHLKGGTFSGRNAQKELYLEILNTMTQILKEMGVGNPTFNIDDEYIDDIRKRMKDQYVGKTSTMKNGQKAEIIVFRNGGDIDVRFEDGTIVKHRYLHNFVSGEIKNPNYDPSNIEGLTVQMLNGLKATCIKYKNSKDIDIQFEDGVIVKSKAKNNFLRGRIAHPNVDPYNQTRKPVVGLTKMMNCGMNATCIAYRSSSDIDIKFEDGTIVEHRTKAQLLNGGILHPKYKKRLF